jgi:type IV pilus assembly protein PilQ
MVRPFGLFVALSGAVAFQPWFAALAAQPGQTRSIVVAQVPQSQRVDPASLLQLKVRRLPDAIELIIEGTGPAPQLQQGSSGTSWQGQLFTAVPAALRVGPQRLSLPEVGLQAVSFEGVGQSFALTVTPVPGINLGRPVVSADGRDLIVTFASPVPQASLQTIRPNLSQPGAIPQPTFAPPLQQRAVAPPLGDMAVGTMTLRNPGYLELSGPPVTMTLKNASAKDALMALAQLGGYGFAYVAEPVSSSSVPAGALDPGSQPISLTFRGESYGRAFNTALLAAGLQGKREGRVILAGPKALSKTFGPQLSKIYRLNQVGPNAAADYLANLGASVTKTNTITTSVTQGVAQGEAVSSGANSQTTQSSTVTNVEAYGASSGPLLGLRATTDTRLGTITLVGDPAIVSIAEQYLKKLDLRQRQVALTVQILDVNLDNAADISNSFAVRWGNNFIVNDRGQMLGAFGDLMPPTVESFSPLSGLRTTVNDSINSLTQGVDAARETILGSGSFAADTGTRSESRSTSSSSSSSGSRTTRSSSVKPNPGSDYPNNNFFNFVRAQIISGSTKLLASPTLILQENAAELRGSEAGGGGGGQGNSGDSSTGGGLDEYTIDSPIGRRRANEGVVRVGVNVPTKVETTQNENSSSTSCTIEELTTAGLVLGARIEKIDDNGFVTFALSPSVSAVVDELPAGTGCPPISILAIRRLDTGALRVRDGQTLILTGVISESDRQVVNKWPILGDIPLIGQFFRATTSRKEKRELVIMVSPRIVNDDQGGVFGYGYQPSSAPVREFFGGASF